MGDAASPCNCPDRYGFCLVLHPILSGNGILGYLTSVGRSLLFEPYFAAVFYRVLACPALKTANCLRTYLPAVFAVQQGMLYTV